MAERLTPTDQRRRPLAGQLSLIGDPPVTYCRRCGRRLKDKRSIKRRAGPTCYSRERESEPSRQEDP